METLLWKDAREKIKKGVNFVEFAAPWCPDCVMMKPVIEQVEQEIKNLNLPVNFYHVNADESGMFRKADAEVAVLRIPTHYIVKDGKQVFIGYEYFPKHILVEKIKELFK
ncbi:THIOREDOXIN [Mycoplasmopsis pulmonis]|uniref:Thioredoxin n=1 Tax=Mycoplasmopsis pulmonis (strain UAB CTIP) TaxID=272635 RepID=THIO_MYCPU|nr:thioredoxin family protein [Mycoplasmopsis pulmonis]Q98PL5.1 RecName: Full=Thioredoxin; Short=Trx [Mycoplasmopsis pulmonis UAB CTIP]CAC13880.1 THIOREDOXIN [Mycoplasmopsis pulmonis]VEU68473.1 Thioredoxin [Mycoplasmopsis pulmonis]